jgi:hypothetical protein
VRAAAFAVVARRCRRSFAAPLHDARCARCRRQAFAAIRGATAFRHAPRADARCVRLIFTPLVTSIFYAFAIILPPVALLYAAAIAATFRCRRRLLMLLRCFRHAADISLRCLICHFAIFDASAMRAMPLRYHFDIFFSACFFADYFRFFSFSFLPLRHIAFDFAAAATLSPY